MRKQTFLFSASYIMDNTTVALCGAAQRKSRGEEEEEEEKGEAIHL